MRNVLIAIGAIIGIGLLIKFWDKIFSPSASSTTAPADGTVCDVNQGKGPIAVGGTYQNGVCVKNAPAPAEGSPCTTEDNKSGVITKGVCIVVASQPKFNQIRITNPNGTSNLAVKDGNFVSMEEAIMIPFGTVLTVTEFVVTPHNYYNTPSGWIDGNDAQIILLQNT